METFEPISGPTAHMQYPECMPPYEVLVVALSELKKHPWMHVRAHVCVKDQFSSRRKSGRSSLTMDMVVYDPSTLEVWAIIWTRKPGVTTDRQIKRSKEVGVPVYVIDSVNDVPELISKLLALSCGDFFLGL